jgi:plasmid stability protein
MILRLELSREQMAVLQSKAESHGVSVEQCAGKILEQALSSDASTDAFEDRLAAIWADVPDQLRAKLPVNGASEHDHYIYGVPKRNG